MNDDHQQQIEHLAAKISSLEKDHNEIRATLSGDISGRQGAMQFLLQLMKDVYGETGDKKSGILARVGVLEDNMRKVIWVCLGASLVIGLLWKVLK